MLAPGSFEKEANENKVKKSSGENSPLLPVSVPSIQNLSLETLQAFDAEQERNQQKKHKIIETDPRALARFKKIFKNYEAELKSIDPNGEIGLNKWMSRMGRVSLALWFICIAVYSCTILGSIYSWPVFAFAFSPQIILASMGVLFIVDCLTILLIQHNSLSIVNLPLEYQEVNQNLVQKVLKKLPYILRQEDLESVHCAYSAPSLRGGAMEQSFDEEQQDQQGKWDVNSDDSPKLIWLKRTFRRYESECKNIIHPVGETSLHKWMSRMSLSLWIIFIAIYSCAVLGSIYSLPMFAFFEFVLSPQIVLACMGVLFIVDSLIILLLIPNNALSVVNFKLAYQEVNERLKGEVNERLKGTVQKKLSPDILRQEDLESVSSTCSAGSSCSLCFSDYKKSPPNPKKALSQGMPDRRDWGRTFDESIENLVARRGVHYDHSEDEIEEKDYMPILSDHFIPDENGVVQSVDENVSDDGVKVTSESTSRTPSESPTDSSSNPEVVYLTIET